MIDQINFDKLIIDINNKFFNQHKYFGLWLENWLKNQNFGINHYNLEYCITIKMILCDLNPWLGEQITTWEYELNKCVRDSILLKYSIIPNAKR